MIYKYMNMYRFNLLFILLLTFVNIFPGNLVGQDVAGYDENISKLVGKLIQYPENEKRMAELNDNFNLANQADLNDILELKATGQPDIWYRIYQAHKRIKDRQDLVMTLPPKTIRQIKFEYIDNSKGLEESKNRATLYSFALAEKLLDENNPASARKAYFELLKVALLQDGNYKDLDKLLRKSILICSTSMEFELSNRTGKKLTGDIVGRLNKIVGEYKKAKYGEATATETSPPLKFVLRVVLNEINVSPDQIKELNYGEERDIYRNNEVVDTISCQVNEYRQLKISAIVGRIDYIDVQMGKVVNVVPIKVESLFTNSYGTLQGNPDAAGDDTRKLIRSKQAEYPSSEQMILDATDEFVKQAKEIILAE